MDGTTIGDDLWEQEALATAADTLAAEWGRNNQAQVLESTSGRGTMCVGGTVGDLKSTYEQFADDELLKLAGEREQLMEDARLALESEMRRRGLVQADILTFNSEIEQAEAERNTADIGVFHPYGIGKRFYGRQNRFADAMSGTEEYDTTLWVVALWFPLVPLCSVRIRRKTGTVGSFLQHGAFEVVQPKPRDWGQIFKTWTLAVIAGTAVLFGLKVLLESARR